MKSTLIAGVVLFAFLVAVPAVAPLLLGGQDQSLNGAVTEPSEDAPKSFPNEGFNASIVQVLAHRDRYDGRRVQLQGYLTVEFEGDAIYLHRDDAAYGLTANGFWLKFDPKKLTRQQAETFHKKYVLIEGTFDKDSRGHLSLWQGTVTVDRIVEKKAR